MLEPRVLDFFDRVAPIRTDDALLAAVSGGPDSVALFHLLLAVRDTLGVRLEVAHLDHSLRGKEAEADAVFVAHLCEQHGLTLHRRRVDIPALRAEQGGSLEALARRERYAFLEEARAVAGARWIVTGHTANDQVETYLMNLLRGSGPRGLGGMLAVGPGAMCRPLLGTWRHEIMAYLETENEPYRLDTTNLDLSLTRNWVRHRLIPLLEEELGDTVLRTLARESQLMNDLDEFLAREASRLLAASTAEGGEPGESDETRLDLPRLRAAHRVLQRSALRAAIEEWAGTLQDITLAHVESIMDLVEKETGTGSVDLPGGLVARREYDTRVLGPAESARPGITPPEPSPPLDLSHPGELNWGRTRIRWTLGSSGEVRGRGGEGDPRRAVFDRSEPIPPVYLRGVRPGDRVEPLGMEGTQKLSDLFINRKIPRHLRTAIPLLCDNGGPDAGERILWVVGERRSRHALVGMETPQVVVFEAETIA
jgi:tRNA(Ile)-lysidine synthase